jgi:pimeloyl-ACP methyl ester carboxylesterase
MSPPIFGLNEPHRLPPGENNQWFCDRNKKRAIVFVHGILSDSRDCWYREPTDISRGVYWPDLIRDDRRFANYSIYLGGYRTGLDSGGYKVEDCAQELVDALRRPDAKTENLVLKDKSGKGHNTVVFVCHSMGGIVVRYMLTARPKLFEDTCVALALIASPSLGSAWANRLDLLIKYFKNKQGATLRLKDSILTDLDSRFRILMEDKGIPYLKGREACEESFILKPKWGPGFAPIVPEQSTGGYFGLVRTLRGTDHFTCVKPSDTSHPSHEFLVDFCRDLDSQGFHEQASSKSAKMFVPSPSSAITASDHVCDSFYWDVMIDEEGDAHNEMTYVGVTVAVDNVFPLSEAAVQSGHTTPYDLVCGDRTSFGATLEAVSATPTSVKMQVRLAEEPTAARPARFCLSSYDWNVYAMNMEEYRQKPGWREDGLDFAEKTVDAPWGILTIVMKFPEQMIFARAPFFEVHDPADDFDGRRNDDLTAKYQQRFHYSRRQRLAVLVIPKPPWPFSYRISWLLGESPVRVTSALEPRQRNRQRTFAHKLLEMRKKLFEGQGDLEAARHIENVVNQTLATVAEYLQTRVGASGSLDPSTLELSLMVLDEDNPVRSLTGNKELPVLRIVAGTQLEKAGYRDLALIVGDGNAGRAWKRRMARLYDGTAEDPKCHIYVPLADLPRHRFLLSIPLIDKDLDALVFGILNVGTFSESQARLLRLLGSADEIQELATYAQSYVLTKLLEEVSI